MAKFYKFDSGLTLLYETNKINKSTDIDISFNCGARCDGALPGLSHFCEHMFFSGTDKLSKEQVMKRYFDFIKTNAYTSFDNVLFTGSIITSKLRDYLSVVQDMICNSTFTKQAVEDEKEIVIQEIACEVDKHFVHASRLIRYTLYNLEYFKHGILGSKESVNKITSKDVKNYVKKYFVKNNCVISICTPLSFNKTKQIVKKYFNDIMPSNNLKPLPYLKDKLTMQDSVEVFTKEIDKNFFAISFMLPRKGPDLRYRVQLGVICNMIDDITDGLTKILRVDNNLIYYMDADYDINFENSYIYIITEVGKENIKPCLDVISTYIKNLLKDGFTKQQFEKELYKNEYYNQTKVVSPHEIKSNLERYRHYGRFVSDKEIDRLVQTFALDEINQTMREIFNSAKIQVFSYGNATKKDVYTIKQIQKKFN